MKLENKHLEIYDIGLLYLMGNKNEKNKLKSSIFIAELVAIGYDFGGTNPDFMFDNDWDIQPIKNVRPFLYPLSSITKKHILKLLKIDFNPQIINNITIDNVYSLHDKCFSKLIEWHFDVFGLIENGLAINKNEIENYKISPTLKELRLHRGYNQKQLAKLSKTNNVVISYVENGHRFPRKRIRDNIENCIGKIDWGRTYFQNKSKNL